MVALLLILACLAGMTVGAVVGGLIGAMVGWIAVGAVALVYIAARDAFT